jgi:hypothetical protein
VGDVFLAQVGHFIACGEPPGVERTVDVPRGLLVRRRYPGIGAGRQNALGEVEDLLEALPHDHQVAGQ